MQTVGLILLLAGAVALVMAIVCFIANSGDAPDANIDQMGRSITFSGLWFIMSACCVGGAALISSPRWWVALITLVIIHSACIPAQIAIEWCL